MNEISINESDLSDTALAELLSLTVEVNEDGDIEYRNHLGQLHRIHGPAVVRHTGTMRWCYYGQLHRTNGPAVIWADGEEWWYLNDLRHRADGPAVIYVNGKCEWWLDGHYVTQQQFNEYIKFT